MILIEWLTKPHYLFTALDAMIMAGELGAVVCILLLIDARSGRKK